MAQHVEVALRVRPTSNDKDGYITIVEPGTVVLQPESAGGVMYNFDFTSAMQHVDNETLYERIGKPCVRSVLEGYNGTVLAYGQTGSGKTFTMLGPTMDVKAMTPEQYGVMPRALQQLMSVLKHDKQILEWTMSISYVEVYCEVIRDLLSVEKAARQDARRGGVEVADVKGVMHLKNVQPVEVRSFEEVVGCIQKAQAVRAQAATNMNDRSSRSHTVLTAWVEIRRGSESVSSKLNLVDLAGSERRNAVGTADARTNREGDAINRSLLNLQTVVMALGQKGSVPSFRASKLTHFLKDSIGGNCKTTMVACIWGDPNKNAETLATCRFAEKMMKVRVAAKKNAGGLNAVHGNQVRLDPVVLALMEKRIAREVAEERARLLAEFQATSGEGNSDLSKEKEAELEALRQRVIELEKRGDAVDMAKTFQRAGHAPSELQRELERMRAELEGMAAMKEELAAARQRVEAVGHRERELEVRHAAMEQQRQAASRLGRVQDVARDDRQAWASSGSIGTARSGGAVDADAPSSSRGSSAPDASEPAAARDSAYDAFTKLRDLQPQYTALAAQRDAGDPLDEDEAECLLFLADEVQRLIDVLRGHGFYYPDVPLLSPDISKPLSEATTDTTANVLADDGLSEESGPSRPEAISSEPPRHDRASQECRDAFAAASVPHSLPGGAEVAHLGALECKSGTSEGTGGARGAPQKDHVLRDMHTTGRAGGSRVEVEYQQKQRNRTPAAMLAGRSTRARAAQPADEDTDVAAGSGRDSLGADGQRSGGSAMVFVAPMRHDHVLDYLNAHSSVDATLPKRLDAMPAMPAQR